MEDIREESHGKYSWMSSSERAIRCYDLEKKRFVHQLDSERPTETGMTVVLKILDNGNFWLMWDRGVGYYYDVYGQKWNPKFSGIQPTLFMVYFYGCG